MMSCLSDVHKICDKWFYMPDRGQIELVLASYLLGKEPNMKTPVWLLLVDQSGEAKTELLRTLVGLPDVLKIHNITKNWLASGNPMGDDLISRVIKGQPLILLVMDLAALMSKRSDDKNEIWAQFRDIFDGHWGKNTGLKSKSIEGAQITLLGAATTRFRSQYIINQQLGSRELLYTQKSNCINLSSENKNEELTKKMNKASSNVEKLKQMRAELSEVVQNFLKDVVVKPLEINEITNPEINHFLNEQCLKLRILRAVVEKDNYSGDPNGEISAETPTRVKQQLARLYYGLKSLEPNYPDERAMKIIERIVESSGNQLRANIMNVFEESPNEWFRIKDIELIVKRGNKTVRTELNSLWVLDWLKKEIRTEMLVSGREIDVPYYKRSFVAKKQQPIIKIVDKKNNRIMLNNNTKDISDYF